MHASVIIAYVRMCVCMCVGCKGGLWVWCVSVIQAFCISDSWVDLQSQQNSGAGSEPTIETPHASIYNGNLEKLLIDAQRESCTPSYANSKESSTRGR